MDQRNKADAFYALHHESRAFLIPNPWDPGSARVLEQFGFEALATTGGGYAFSAGVPDGKTSRSGMLAYIRAIASATKLPVSADLEDGFGDRPEDAAQMIRDAADAGVVGGSIEDRAYGRQRGSSERFYSLQEAADRVRAAVEGARSLPFHFTLTARCENYLYGKADLKDTIRRLQAFQEAGADVLYAPGLRTLNEVREVVTSVDVPVNAIIGRAGDPMSIDDLERIGVRRISLGSTLQRASLATLVDAAAELRDHKTYTFAERAVSHERASELFSPWAQAAGYQPETP